MSDKITLRDAFGQPFEVPAEEGPGGTLIPLQKVQVSGRNLLDDEVVALTGEIQQLANIPSAATIVRLTVEYTPDASEVGGIRFRELGKDPSVNGEFVAGGESVVIGFTHEALEALRFILVGPGTGRVIAKYY